MNDFYDSFKYVDICTSENILLMDSGLIESPRGWNTFIPHENDLALVNDREYIFQNGIWNPTYSEYEIDESEWDDILVNE